MASTNFTHPTFRGRKSRSHPFRDLLMLGTGRIRCCCRISYHIHLYISSLNYTQLLPGTMLDNYQQSLQRNVSQVVCYIQLLYENI